MDLEHDTSGLRADEFIVDFNHSLTVKPCLNLVALYAEAESIPFTFLKDLLFLIWNLNEPSTTV